MDASQREQEIRLSGKLPTVEMFQKYRMGTSGVALVLGAIEFVSH